MPISYSSLPYMDIYNPRVSSLQERLGLDLNGVGRGLAEVPAESWLLSAGLLPVLVLLVRYFGAVSTLFWRCFNALLTLF